MDRSEINEIRKLFNYKEGDGAAGNFSGCFINTDKDIKGRFMKKIYSLEKNTVHKFYDIYRKTLANNDADVGLDREDLEDGGIGFLLDKICATELKNEDIVNILYDRIRDALPENNYVVTLVYYAYDIPVKTKDRLKIDDAGEGIFKFILCSICPVKTAKGSLGYLPDIDRIGENPQLLTVEKPVFGFMYPSFNERSADKSNILCYRTETMDISAELFRHEAPELEKKEPKKKMSLNVDGESELSDTNKAYASSLASSPFPDYSSHSANDDIPSLDTGTLSNDAHYVAERTITDEEEEPDYSSQPSDAEIIRSSGKTMHVDQPKKAKKPVSIVGDVSRVRKKEIDGVVCYVIEVGDATLN